MRAEIISIGTELLLGEIVDTNAAWLAQQLAATGVDVYFRTTVGDNVNRIAQAIELALARADVIITSGGLGPTVDDMTREGIAQAVGVPLVLDDELLAQVRARFGKLGRTMSPNNVKQAYLPRGATGVENPVGTAPCFIVEHNGSSIFVLPGVPREMKYMTETRVLPWLREIMGSPEIILSKTLRTCNIGESMIDDKIADLETSANPTVGLAAHPGQTDIRITAKATTRAIAESLIQEMEARIRERVGDWIYGEGAESIEEVITRMLAALNLSLAVSETNTQGRIAERLRMTPEQLKIIGEILAAPDTASVTEARGSAVAQDLRHRTNTDLALVVVGTMDAGQDIYGSDTGRTAMALLHGDSIQSHQYSLGGLSEMAQSWISVRALDMLRRELLKMSQ